MMCLDQNKQTVYYALLSSVTELTDTEGNYTGEYAPVYSTPVEMRANVSAARGTSDVEQFGINTPYSKTIVTDDLSCPIAEDSVLWIGVPTTAPYNYTVAQIAKSLNSITYAVEEVDVS